MRLISMEPAGTSPAKTNDDIQRRMRTAGEWEGRVSTLNAQLSFPYYSGRKLRLARLRLRRSTSTWIGWPTTGDATANRGSKYCKPFLIGLCSFFPVQLSCLFGVLSRYPACVCLLLHVTLAVHGESPKNPTDWQTLANWPAVSLPEFGHLKNGPWPVIRTDLAMDRAYLLRWYCGEYITSRLGKSLSPLADCERFALFCRLWVHWFWSCLVFAVNRYHHTAPISSIYALREALALLAAEGLDKCWQRHRHCRDRLVTGLAALNLEPLASDTGARLTCITAVQVPEGLDWKAVCTYAMQ